MLVAMQSSGDIAQALRGNGVVALEGCMAVLPGTIELSI